MKRWGGGLCVGEPTVSCGRFRGPRNAVVSVLNVYVSVYYLTSNYSNGAH